jgi:hypothetical protein
MTRDETLAFVRRMRLLGNDRDVHRTDDEALLELSRLMASAYSLGWADEMRRDDERVRQLWVRLKTRGA